MTYKLKRFFSVLIIMLGIVITPHIFAQQHKVACVGNSITYGYGLKNPATQSYPSQMQVLFGKTYWDIQNFGSSGRTMLKSGGYSYWDDPKYPAALAFNPNIVIIALGTNDSKRWLWDAHGSEFLGDYEKMVQSFQALPSKPDIWISLLIPGQKVDWQISNSYIENKVNPEIKKIALDMGLGLIDLHAKFVGHWSDWYQADSVHPSVAGAGVIAREVKKMLLMSKLQIKFKDGKVIAPKANGYQWYVNGIPVDSKNGGQLRKMMVVKPGTYKVSLKLYKNNETRIISKKLDVPPSAIKRH